MGDEEFVGPVSSRGNVKTNYGAVGDGVTDDTAAVQKALGAPGPTNSTLYFPAGTYRISQTLTLTVGNTSTLSAKTPSIRRSSGPAPPGTMLYIYGVATSRFDRLTFDGQGNAAVGVDQSKADFRREGQSRSAADSAAATRDQRRFPVEQPDDCSLPF
jgi:polygalacturonase